MTSIWNYTKYLKKNFKRSKAQKLDEKVIKLTLVDYGTRLKKFRDA